ncbi:hypothetical protein EN829_059180 [Mesorhizobium sp. M00.F.Ca.ET.186.01.1.1]|nr:hypothetical protein EN829_059180 [Mesorhizobium sp. M00.F.Ca.ET.186.01.1.1]
MQIHAETGRTAIQLHSPQNREGGLQIAAGTANDHSRHDTVKLGSVKPRKLPQKPVGAPDDYVDTSKLMQRFAPAFAYSPIESH